MENEDLTWQPENLEAGGFVVSDADSLLVTHDLHSYVRWSVSRQLMLPGPEVTFIEADDYVLRPGWGRSADFDFISGTGITDWLDNLGPKKDISD